MGSLRVVVPFATLHREGCSVQLDEVLVTVQPKPSGAATPAPAAQRDREPVEPDALAETDADLAQQAAISTGVSLIAGGLETLMQRLRVCASQVVVQLAAHGAGSDEGSSAASVHVEAIEYGGTSLEHADDAAGAGVVHVAKTLRFEGLVVRLQPHAPAPAAPPLVGSPDGGGCSGSAEVCLSWGLQLRQHPRLSVHLRLEPVQVHIEPSDIARVGALAGSMSAAPPTPRPATHAAQPTDATASTQQPWGQRSILEELMLPNCMPVVIETLAGEGAGGITGQVSARAVVLAEMPAAPEG